MLQDVLKKLREESGMSRSSVALKAATLAKKRGLGKEFQTMNEWHLVNLERSDRAQGETRQTQLALLAEVYGIPYEDLARAQLREGTLPSPKED